MKGKLPPEDEALWAKVTATVRPFGSPRGNPHPRRRIEPPAPTPFIPDRGRPIATRPAETLDSGWDRRLSRGRAAPEMVIDLHGLTREAARALLYARISDARVRGVRVILVITGKGIAPGPQPADLVPGLSNGRSIRGTIRAELPRWLGEAGLSAHIAAVRNAHPRHGGSGAVYLILRR